MAWIASNGRERHDLEHFDRSSSQHDTPIPPSLRAGHDCEMIQPSTSWRSSPKREGSTAPQPHTIGRATYLVFSTLIYCLVAGFIYRSWWSTLAVNSRPTAGDPSMGAARVRYDHYTHLGLENYERRDFRKAEWAFRKCIELEPERALAYNNLGSALNAQGRWDEAIPVLEHALSLDPRLAIARNNLAWARRERGSPGRVR